MKSKNISFRIRNIGSFSKYVFIADIEISPDGHLMTSSICGSDSGGPVLVYVTSS